MRSTFWFSVDSTLYLGHILLSTYCLAGCLDFAARLWELCHVLDRRRMSITKLNLRPKCEKLVESNVRVAVAEVAAEGEISQAKPSNFKSNLPVLHPTSAKLPSKVILLSSIWSITMKMVGDCLCEVARNASRWIKPADGVPVCCRGWSAEIAERAKSALLNCSVSIRWLLSLIL